jgi:hypothetical protein
VSGAAIGAICVGTTAFLVLLSAVVYKCYRQRNTPQSAETRLSSAIRKGLKEGGTVKKTRIMKHKATSPITPPGHEAGPSATKLSPGGFPGTGHTSMSDSGSSTHVQGDVCYIENEKDGATPEKEGSELLRERQMVEKATTLGNMYFSAEYDEIKSALLVTILRVADLPPRDPSVGGCDPYIKLQLLPEKKHKCKTRVLRKTLDPIYDETFTFYGIKHSQLNGTTLHFVVLSFDRFSRDEIIGEVIYPLAGVDINHKEVSLCHEITPRHMKVSTRNVM